MNFGRTSRAMCVFASLVAASNSLSAQSATPPLLTLAEAISVAELGNVGMVSAKDDIEKASAGVKQVQIQRYPQLKVNGLASYPFQALTFTIPEGALGTYPGTGPLPGKYAVIGGSQSLSGYMWSSASQPLTQLYKVHLAVEQARINVQLATQQQRYTRQQIVQQVRQTYYPLPSMQEQVRALAESVRWLKRADQEAKQQFEQKTILQSQLLSVQAALAQGLYQERLAVDAWTLQKESLNRLLNRPLEQDFSVESEPSISESNPDRTLAHSTALALRPEVRQADLQANSAAYDIRKERSEYIPQVSLTVNEVALSGNKFLPSTIGGAGLQLSWQPFDWGEKKQQLRALKITHNEAVLNQQDTRQAVLLDVDRSLNALQEARLAVAVSRIARDAEREKLREVEAQFERQVTLLSSLLQEKSNVAQEESQYVQAISKLWIAQANLHHSLGEDE